jgi:predicted nucleotidyltransferase
MTPLIESKRAFIEELCRKFHVSRLEVFGSAADGQFDEARSDLDFLVEFQALEPGSLADAYFGLLAELQRLFARKVDLVTPKAIRNPYFLRAVNQTRRMLYAA